MMYRRDAIEAHLAIVYPLALARGLQERAGVAIKRLVKTLLPYRSAVIEINSDEVVLPAQLDEKAAARLQRLRE